MSELITVETEKLRALYPGAKQGWHQDCALDWLCGQSAGDPIHQTELP